MADGAGGDGGGHNEREGEDDRRHQAGHCLHPQQAHLRQDAGRESPSLLYPSGPVGWNARSFSTFQFPVA